MNSFVIPLGVMYAGLAGTLLALLIATATNRWSPKVFFLLALRLAIGWHFLFEGLNKIQSHSIGQTEMNRPFSSEPYFKEADGPLGPLMRKQIGDPEELLKAKTTPASTPAPQAKIEDPNLRLALGTAGVGDEEFIKAVPPAVRKEWDDFAKVLIETYKLSDKEKNRFDGHLDEDEKKELATKTGPGDFTYAAMVEYGKWVVGVEAKDSKVKYVSGDVPLTAPQRLDYLKSRKAELDDLEMHRNTELGNGSGYEMAHIKDAKALVSSARSVLIADADAILLGLKTNAFTTIRNSRFDREAPKPSNAVGKNDAKLAELLPPPTAPKPKLLPPPTTPKPIAFDDLPASVKTMWDKYHIAFEGFYPASEGTAAAFDLAKIRFANWYFDRDEYVGEPKTGFGKFVKDYKNKQEKAVANPKDEAAAVEAATARAALLAALDAKYAEMGAYLLTSLPTTAAKGPIDPPSDKSAIESLDWRTRWMLTAVGAMLLMGLLTRFACLVGGIFLVLTYLTHPPFPWLPLPPGTEGNPIFVNKNAIEFLALMVLMVHPTGRWLGLDALVLRPFCRYECKANPPPPATTASHNDSRS